MRNLAHMMFLVTAIGCAPPIDIGDAGYAAYSTDAGDEISCVPNLNGMIVAMQLQPDLGVVANYLVSPQGQTRTVDLTGSVNAAGNLVWDWSAPDSTDEVAPIEATSLANKWYGSSFPNGQYAAPIDAADTSEGVYAVTDNAILFYGFASTQEHPSTGKTLYVYEQPVPLYQFPIEPGRSWTASGTVTNQMLNGLPYAGTDTYELSVGASGILDLPQLTFTQVMQIHMKTTVVPIAGETTSTWVVSFFAQCFGEVARATSLTDETSENFTTAAEVRRLGLSGD